MVSQCSSKPVGMMVQANCPTRAIQLLQHSRSHMFFMSACWVLFFFSGAAWLSVSGVIAMLVLELMPPPCWAFAPVCTSALSNKFSQNSSHSFMSSAPIIQGSAIISSFAVDISPAVSGSSGQRPNKALTRSSSLKLSAIPSPSGSSSCSGFRSCDSCP